MPVAGLRLVTIARAGSPLMTGVGLVPTSAKLGLMTMARLRQLPRASAGNQRGPSASGRSRSRSSVHVQSKTNTNHPLSAQV